LIVFIALFFVLGLPIIFAIYYFERIDKPLELAKIRRLEKTDKASETVRERQVIVKEIVMTPCQYCRGLIPQTSIFCPNCGAKRKA
jgi:hypothetical protein